jgi:hypothetical protein
MLIALMLQNFSLRQAGTRKTLKKIDELVKHGPVVLSLKVPTDMQIGPRSSSRGESAVEDFLIFR